jgi:3-oxoadipate enol-lactonase / 4-carboxymuconolactone decarboxylase
LPFVNANGARMYYRLDGRADLPVLVLSHSLGCDHGQWDPQVPDLLRNFQILRYDLRGHGASEATPGDYTIEQLGRDVLGIADELGIAKFHFNGLSLGGMIGQWLAANASDQVISAVLANTSPHYADPTLMKLRQQKVLNEGMTAVEEMVMSRFFMKESLAKNPPEVASTRRTLLATDPKGYAGCCGAIIAMDNRPLLPNIKIPTLVISSEFDLSTPWTGSGEVLASSIPGAQVVHLPTAHLSNLEKPRSYTAALLEFFKPNESHTSVPGWDPYESGMKVRRSVLGDAHVDRSIARTTPFTKDFQDMITRFAWGTVWTRTSVDHRTRRMMVLTAMAALGRWEEFRMHVRAGLAHELEPCDLKEVLLQVGIYAGVPVANTGFQIAAEELEPKQ